MGKQINFFISEDMEWDKNKKPPENICPSVFCFLWSESNSKCRETFGKCRRATGNNNDADYYEPCEPKLDKHGLPWFYFIASEKNLVDELQEDYLRESKKLWGDDK